MSVSCLDNSTGLVPKRQLTLNEQYFVGSGQIQPAPKFTYIISCL
jgi:hypothetical protein